MPVISPQLIPANESARLRALQHYDIAGTAPEHLFDDLIQLVAKLFDMPIAMLTLVMEEKVWFKANSGLPPVDQVDRDTSLCSAAILDNDTTVFEDLKTNPCHLIRQDVVRALALGFYAGAPVTTTDGYPIGVLCVLDKQARPFSPQERELLGTMATVVMRTIELRQATASDPARSNPQLRLAHDALQYSMDRIGDLVGTLNAGVAPRRDTGRIYQTTREIADYINRFVGGSLPLIISPAA